VIVSHQHRCIFLKTRKTAGTSIEVFLGHVVGADAIVTPVNPPVAGHQPRNFEPPKSRRVRRQLAGMERGERDLKRGLWYFNHMSASLMRERLGSDLFDGYFKFCFERDPWDKTLSWYFYRTRDLAVRPPFAEWLQRRDLPLDWDRYCIGGTPAMDFVGRFENLAADLQQVCTRLGIDRTIDLSSEKGGVRPDAAAPGAMYDATTSEFVGEAFRREIETYGYLPPRLDH
jgi:hypothetical protein